jgi:phosphate acyltransferase
VEIIIDAPGCERGYSIAVRAGIRAVSSLHIQIAFAGDSGTLSSALRAEGYEPDTFRLIHTDQSIGMNESPLEAIKQKPHASIIKALEEVAGGESQAVVSAGHTGATVISATRTLGLFDYLRKPALCQIMPTASLKHFLLLDAGACVSVSPSDLINFAMMGSAAATQYFGITLPRVGLLNIGREAGKGNRRLLKIARLLEKAPVNFTGNIEGDQIWFDAADVIITDGITGNILLKAAEGLARLLIQEIRSLHATGSDILNKGTFRSFHPAQYGGAPLLGINGVCIVSHGNADEGALFNAIKTAKWCVEQEIPGEIASALARHYSTGSQLQGN